MSRSLLIQLTLLAAIVVGCTFRISGYAKNYSFFIDECALALKLDVHTISSERGAPAEYAAAQMVARNDIVSEQSAPLGFLLAERAVARLLGPSERVLRFIPFLIGLITLGAFWRLNRKLQPGWAAAGAVWLAAVNQGLISYSAQAKQYSMEILAAVLILLWCYPLFCEMGVSRWSLRIRALCSGSLLWFSFSAVFVLSGIALTLLIESLLSRKKARIVRSVEVGGLWIAMFVPVFFVSIKPRLSSQRLHDMWIGDYMPSGGTAMLSWLASKFVEVCVTVFNKRLWPMAGALLVAGFMVALRRKEWEYVAAASGLLVCGVAAALQSYPFTGRLLLFAVPGLILVLTRGAQWVIESVHARWRPITQLAAVLALLWCLQSAVRATILANTFIDEPREALRFMQRNWRPGDHVLATQYASPCLVYYTPGLGLEPSAVALDITARANQTQPLSLSVPIPAGRVWLVEMRTPWLTRGQSVPIQEFLEVSGHKIAQYDVEWTSVILFDMALSRGGTASPQF